jgi:hypothetical protein
VHQLGLRVFGATMWKLLIIEPFSQQKLNKIETENCIGISGCSWCCWKALGELDLIEFVSQFSKLRCGRYSFFNGFNVFKQIQTNCKSWVWNNQLSPECVHITKFKNFQFRKCEK